jgi:cell division septal protein FtsQ
MRIKRLVVTGTLFCLLGVGLIKTPIFNIHQIQLNGIHFLPPSEIEPYTNQWKSMSYLRLRITSIFRPLLAEVSQIEHASIQWRGNHTVVVNINEKRPAAMLIHNGKSTLISDDGTIFSAFNSHALDIDQILIIKGISATDFQSYLLQSPASDIKRMFNWVMNELPNEPIQIEKQSYNWILFKDDKLPFLLGDLSRLSEVHIPIKRLFSNLSQFKQQHKTISAVDIRHYPKIFVRYD